VKIHDRNVRQVVTWARLHGWTVQPTRGGHLRLTHERGGMVILTSTCSNRFVPRRMIAELRRQERRWR